MCQCVSVRWVWGWFASAQSPFYERLARQARTRTLRLRRSSDRYCMTKGQVTDRNPNWSCRHNGRYVRLNVGNHRDTFLLDLTEASRLFPRKSAAQHGLHRQAYFSDVLQKTLPFRLRAVLLKISGVVWSTDWSRDGLGNAFAWSPNGSVHHGLRIQDC